MVLASLAGVVLALLLAGLVWLAWRVLRFLLALIRLPRQRVAVVVARLRGVRLTRSRAIARAHGDRAAGLDSELRRLRAELRLARAERDEARAEAARLRGEPRPRPWRRGEDRFQRAKREFARRFHPDRLPRGARDFALRVAIFRDYWAVLKRIERGD